jgi:hypothetical protein
MTVRNIEGDPSLPGCYNIFTDIFSQTFRSIAVSSYSDSISPEIFSNTAVCYTNAVSRKEKKRFIQAEFRHAASLMRATL